MTTNGEVLRFRSTELQALRRLLGRRSERFARSLAVIEGPRTFLELLEQVPGFANRVTTLYVPPDWEDIAAVAPAVHALLAQDPHAVVRFVAAHDIARLATLQQLPPLLAVVQSPVVEGLPTLGAYPKGRPVVVLSDVGDPGNVGTIVRSAEAFEAVAVLATRTSVDFTNPKTLRATAGSLFRVPVFVADEDDVVAWCAGTHPADDDATDRVAIALAGGSGVAPENIFSHLPNGDSLLQTPLLVVGNEAHGVSPALLAACVGVCTIPMAPSVESLNAGVAVAVVLADLARQRRSGPSTLP